MLSRESGASSRRWPRTSTSVAEALPTVTVNGKVPETPADSPAVISLRSATAPLASTTWTQD